MSGARQQRAFRVSAAVAIIGAAVLLVGLVVAPAAVATSYLVAITATLAVVLGMLLLVMTVRLSGAVWFVVLRARAEAVVGALPALAVLMVPLFIAPHATWPTATHPSLFTARALVYWIVWLTIAEWLRRTPSLASAVGIPTCALALTFASFDWMMSLSPGWSSTVYGVYYFAGATVSALAMLAVLARRMTTTPDERAPTTEHFQALGRLTLAFVMFWAYLWYVQFFIIWIADIPREATWYAVRLRGGWEALAVATLVAGALVPFVVLAIRAARGSAIVMALVGIGLLVAHYLDVYWLIVPGFRPGWTMVHLVTDAAALAFVAGTTTAVAVWRDADAPAVPVADPQLASSLQYEAH